MFRAEQAINDMHIIEKKLLVPYFVSGFLAP